MVSRKIVMGAICVSVKKNNQDVPQFYVPCIVQMALRLMIMVATCVSVELLLLMFQLALVFVLLLTVSCTVLLVLKKMNLVVISVLVRWTQ